MNLPHRIAKVKKPELRRRHGKTIHVHPDIVTWQKRRKRFLAAKAQAAKLFYEAKLTPEQIKAFLDTPNPLTSNRPPRDFYTPFLIRHFAKAVLATFGKKP